MQETSFLIVDDHPITRMGVAALINQHPEWHLLKELKDGKEAWVYLQNHDLPDVLILDIDMPNMTGIELTRLIREQNILIHIILLSHHLNKNNFFCALDLGVKGILCKNNAIHEIEACVENVLKGNTFYSQSIGGLSTQTAVKEKQKVLQKLSDLTKRELLVLEQIAQEMTTEEIADNLSNSTKTIKNHRSNIASKLGLVGNYSILKFAIKYKFLIESYRKDQQ
ncbi:MAG: response regulator [Flammeovirgaceae bacterium]